MSTLEFRLLNEFQRDLPLCPEPYREFAARLGREMPDVLAALARLQKAGKVSRVGATFRPGAFGASTLAAMRVPAHRLDDVAQAVNAFPEVNHNYQRDHEINLWFVVTAADAQALAAVLARIESRCALPAMRLPLLTEYHIDLGFDLASGRSPQTSARARAPSRPLYPTARERGLLAALEKGLPLAPRPYALLGEQCAMSEEQVIATLDCWRTLGAMRRFGVIVRHWELGFTENAMVVWDVPDDRVDSLGIAAAGARFVTLCYRRARDLRSWPYNLYCMIHGGNRMRVLGAVYSLARRCGLEAFPQQVLFGLRRFKQQGARYASAR
ncbi:MAG TPA: Lrp/AsnC family transcriptional regulator [Burkholderiales bacterium]|nr:Lrp/AsnC family transcriptional regulator [Burkholderiales bacterium]